ncbi:17390_t:CDS:2, partial [Cetraspora pellucida]
NLKIQIEKNKEFQQNVKLLQDQADQLGESETLRKAKEAYAKAREETIRRSEKLDGLKKSVEKIGTKVSDTIKDVGENPYVKGTIKGTQETISNMSSKISSTTEPIRQTKMYANIRDTLKETQKPDELLRETQTGASMVLHKDSAWKESWNKFKENNPVMQGIFNMKKNYQDSDNAIIAFTREFTDRISYTLGSFFQENETAQAITQLKIVDPGFNIEEFMKELREFIIPEIMEAYLKGDMETLKIWCSEATYSLLNHGMQSQIQQGLVSDSRVLDIRNVELATAKVLENGIPVLVVSFNTQEVVVFRDQITKEIIYGREDQIDQSTYLCVITKQEDNLTDPITAGWRII